MNIRHDRTIVDFDGDAPMGIPQADRAVLMHNIVTDVKQLQRRGPPCVLIRMQTTQLTLPQDRQ